MGDEEGRVAFQSMLYRLFCEPRCRRKLLRQWHSHEGGGGATGGGGDGRLASVFERFIEDVLFRPVAFHMLHDRFHVFGDAYSVRYEWLADADRAVVLGLYRERKSVFRVLREYHNDQFEYSRTVYGEDDVVTWVWRRQLVRDFVWMVRARLPKDAHAHLELLAALQRLIVGKKRSRHALFLSELHAALQGQTCLDEVLCWGTHAADAHPDETLANAVH